MQANDIKKCKKCKALVQKVSGCNHMTCKVCKYQWCWLCGSPYSDIHFSPLNPLGCANMQNRQITSFSKCKMYLLRLLMIIGFLCLLPFVIPGVLAFCGPVLVYKYLIKLCGYPYRCHQKTGILIISLPLGLIMDPLIWIGSLFYFIPSIYNGIKSFYQNRQNMIEGSENQIKKRLM